jgi:hypothetical protein
MFDMGKWTLKLLNINGVYKALSYYVNDEKALDVHINDYQIYRFDESNDIKCLKLSESENKDEFYNNIKMDIESSFEIYSTHTIVLLATYLENMNMEFFENLFNQRNELILNYLDNEKKGYIKLDLILKSENKEEVIRKLISTAKKNVSNGSLAKIAERINKLTKFNIDSSLIKSIQSNILDRRNSIIHESESFLIEEDDIVNCINDIENYLVALGKASKKMSLPYIDQANLLD